ncbi:MAG: hypothetical protein HC840_00470 [Leptolyngbyaceae cyanobacterium RM2_2_4]|nr:hypothetical protein [Leptolyngbyaceae cyanobacterium RM2_2_4]
MKRVIKFWNKFSDKGFSDCGTVYEVLPILVQDDAGPKELRAIAKELGIETRGREVMTHEAPNGYRRGETSMTHSIPTGQKQQKSQWDKEVVEWQLGFVTLNTKDGILKPVEKLGKRITKEQASQIIEDRAYGLDDVGDFSMIPSKIDLQIIMSGWNYYHEIKMLGYDMERFEKLITRKKKSQDGERNFYDSVFRCDDCGTWDSQDSGHTYNYRIMDGEQLGLNCGCAHERAKESFLDMVNDPKQFVEREAAQELVDDGLLEHVERFIGGWTDGRGGSYGGISTREGTPEGVMNAMLKEEPKSKFVISHDESGQFQSYFSIYRVTKKALKQNNKRQAA